MVVRKSVLNKEFQKKQGKEGQGGKRFRRFRFRFRFREKRFRRFRFPVPVRFLSHPALRENLAGFKEALGPFFVERPKTRLGAFSGDSVRIWGPYLRFLACISDFWPVSPIFGGNPNHFAEYQPRIMSQGFYSKGSLNPPKRKSSVLRRADFVLGPKDTWLLYYKSPPCTFYHKFVLREANWGP